MSSKSKKHDPDEDSCSSSGVCSTASSSNLGDEPPSFDEMLYDARLFQLFAKFMAAQQAAENVMFLRQVYQFRMYRAPKKVLIQEAQQIAWRFVSDASPTPVNVSSEERESLMEICFDPDAEAKIDNSVFRQSYQAIFALTLPHYRDWLSTGEWREVGHFHRIPPPTFAIVLETPELSDLFSQYLKTRHKPTGPDPLIDTDQLWQFTLIAKDFRNGDLNRQAEFIDPKELEKEKGPLSKEEYGKKLYRKFKKVMPIPHDSAMPYSVYIVSALNKVIEIFNTAPAFQRWLSLKQYIGVDYLLKTVHQTMTPDGFVVAPNMASAIASSMRGPMGMLVADTDAAKGYAFVLDLLDFENLVRGITPGKKPASSASLMDSAAAVSTKKEVIDEAKRIFKTYLEDGNKSGMYCDPAIVEEVKASMKAVAKSKTIRSDIFHRAGAFEFHRLSRMFGREVRAGLAWTTKSYDNNSRRTREISSIFDIRQLPEDVDFRLVPSVDDLLMNENLKKDFEAFIPRELSTVYEDYFAMYTKIMAMPPNQRGDEVENVVMLMGSGATKFKELEVYYKTISKGLSGRKAICDSPFSIWLYALTDCLVSNYFHEWVNKRYSFWSKEHWNPARDAVFSRLSLSYSAGDASKKGETEKKSGWGGFFSRKKKTPTVQAKNVAILPPKDVSSSSMSSPPLGATSSRSASLADTGIHSASSDVSDEDSMASLSFVPLIPTLLETVSSAYLRKMLQVQYLETHLPDDDMGLWKSFCGFFEKYMPLSDSDIESCQDEMRAAALAILDKHESLMKKGYFLRSQIEKKGLITPAFFREEEMNLVRPFYSGFERVLHAKGWLAAEKQ